MLFVKKCPHCGKEFKGLSNKIYCCTYCKTGAFHQATRIRKNNSNFIAMQVVEEPTFRHRQEITICYPNGVRIELPGQEPLNLANIRALVTLI